MNADSSQDKRQSFNFTLRILLAMAAVCFFLSLVPAIWQFILTGWPPVWMERHAQRQQILVRIQSAGGWAALKRDCDALVAKFKEDPSGFIWREGDTDPLPAAIAALKPRRVEYFPPKFMQQFASPLPSFDASNVVVRISVFGAHLTGGHGQPWLGLDVLCEPVRPGYDPNRAQTIIPSRNWTYRKIANDIYEYY